MQPKDILTWPCTRPVLLNKSQIRETERWEIRHKTIELLLKSLFLESEKCSGWWGHRVLIEGCSFRAREIASGFYSDRQDPVIDGTLLMMTVLDDVKRVDVETGVEFTLDRSKSGFAYATSRKSELVYTEAGGLVMLLNQISFFFPHWFSFLTKYDKINTYSSSTQRCFWSTYSSSKNT